MDRELRRGVGRLMQNFRRELRASLPSIQAAEMALPQLALLGLRDLQLKGAKRVLSADNSRLGSCN